MFCLNLELFGYTYYCYQDLQKRKGVGCSKKTVTTPKIAYGVYLKSKSRTRTWLCIFNPDILVITTTKKVSKYVTLLKRSVYIY